MYVAMNRFQVLEGHEHAFEDVWRRRESRLHEMAGFMDFRLLRGPQTDGHTLYASHTIWASHADFETWTRSAQFRDAHKNAGDAPKLTSGHPIFEGFEAVDLGRD